MGDPIISGGNGSNGKVSVRGKDNTPLAELVASDNETVIGAGNKDRPGRLSMFDGAGKLTANLTAASAALILGGNAVNGKVSVRGKDGTPLAELMAADNESTIGVGNKGRPGRLKLFNKDAEQTANLTAADATLTLGGKKVSGKVSVLGEDGTPLVELVAAGKEAVIGAGNKSRPGRLNLFSSDAEQTVNLTAEDATLALGGNSGGKGSNGKVSVLSASGNPLVELVATDDLAEIGIGNLGHPARLKMFSSEGEQTVNLTAEDGTLILGGNSGGTGRNGKVSVRGGDDKPLIELVASEDLAAIGIGNTNRPGQLRMFSKDAQPTVRLTAEDGTLILGGSEGGNGRNGVVSVRGANDAPLAEIVTSDNEAVIGVGNQDRPGRLRMFSSNAQQTVNLSAEDARLTLGGGGHQGMVFLQSSDDVPAALLVAADDSTFFSVGTTGRPGFLSMLSGDGQQTVSLAAGDAELRLGGNDRNGKVSVRGKDGTPLAEVVASDDEAAIGVGNMNRPGLLKMFSKEANQTVTLAAEDATLTLGGNGRNGKASVLGTDGLPLVEMIGLDNESYIGLGQLNRPGRIAVFNGAQDMAIELNGAGGDIWITNADCAEEFDLADPDAEPGMVMVLTEEGRVVPSTVAYDSKVVGVASGAGTYRPGLILDRRETGLKRIAIALVGKVFCFVDATQAAVRVGDLLTTADRPGYAMRATDQQSSFGAVLGKALAPLSSGCSLIPILVTLQ